MMKSPYRSSTRTATPWIATVAVFTLLVVRMGVHATANSPQAPSRHEVPPLATMVMPTSGAEGCAHASSSETPTFAQLTQMLDEALPPSVMRRSSMHVPGYRHRQIMVVDASSRFGLLLKNLLFSLSRVGISRIIVLSLDDLCSDAGIHEFSVGVECIEIGNLLRAAYTSLEATQTPSYYKDERAVIGNLWELMLLRAMALWRITENGYGATLLDADVTFFENYFSLNTSSYSVIASVNHAHQCDPMHCIPVDGTTCLTPIPPITFQPAMAPWLQRICVEYAEKPTVITANMCTGLFSHLKAAGVSMHPSHRVTCHDMRGPNDEPVCLLDSKLARSRCDLERIGPTNQTTLLSYHANCSFELEGKSWEEAKVLLLKEQGAWFLD